MFGRPPGYCKALRVIRRGKDAIGQNRILVVDYTCDDQKGQLRPLATTFVSLAKTAEEKAKDRALQIQEATGIDPIEQDRIVADYLRNYKKRQQRPARSTTDNVGSAMTDDERRDANAQRMRVFRQMQRAAEVTPEEASARRAAEADRVRRHRQKRRAEETPDVASARRAANAARMKLQRQKRLAESTPEEASQNGNAHYISGQPNTTTAHTNLSPAIASDRHRLPSQNGSDELRSCDFDGSCVDDGTPSVLHTIAKPVTQPLVSVHSITDVFFNRQHPCDFCGDEFLSLSDLEMHQKSEHPDWAAVSLAT